MAEIVFDHVTKVFQEQIALEDISFQIEKGEFVFVTGKSGAGKRFCISESFGGVKGERDSSL